MKIRNFLILLITILVFSLYLVSPVLAQGSGSTQTSGETDSGGGDLVDTTSLQNPLGPGNLDPRAIIGNIIRVMLGLVGSLALAVFVWGGFTWVMSAGNDEKIKKGKDMMVWASLGLAVVFLSYVLVRFIIEALTSSGGSTG